MISAGDSWSHLEKRQVSRQNGFFSDGLDHVGETKDHVQVAALAQALNVHVKVAYLDGHATDAQINFVDFSENASAGGDPLVLLYR